MNLNGWRVTALLSMLVFLISAPLLILYGINESSIHIFLRTTARCSTILFLTAFVASALVRLNPTNWTKWLGRNRRYIGVSFAFSHTLHLFGIIQLLQLKPNAFPGIAGVVTYVGGGLAFVFLYTMTATSFDRTAAWIGPKAWRRIHKTGMYYFWGIFCLDYVGLAFDSPLYIPLAVLVIASLFIRIWAWKRKRAMTFAAASAPAKNI
jgi:methionine sulfoxide reductase heme-binding subunit